MSSVDTDDLSTDKLYTLFDELIGFTVIVTLVWQGSNEFEVLTQQSVNVVLPSWLHLHIADPGLQLFFDDKLRVNTFSIFVESLAHTALIVYVPPFTSID